MKTGIELIADERKTHYDEHDWSQQHDSEHTEGELALAAMYYAAPASYDNLVPALWPQWWSREHAKRETDVRCLVEDRIHDLAKAGALIAAEIDRIIDITPKLKQSKGMVLNPNAVMQND